MNASQTSQQRKHMWKWFLRTFWSNFVTLFCSWHSNSVLIWPKGRPTKIRYRPAARRLSGCNCHNSVCCQIGSCLEPSITSISAQVTTAKPKVAALLRFCEHLVLISSWQRRRRASCNGTSLSSGPKTRSNNFVLATEQKAGQSRNTSASLRKRITLIPAISIARSAATNVSMRSMTKETARDWTWPASNFHWERLCVPRADQWANITKIAKVLPEYSVIWMFPVGASPSLGDCRSFEFPDSKKWLRQVCWSSSSSSKPSTTKTR